MNAPRNEFLKHIRSEAKRKEAERIAKQLTDSTGFIAGIEHIATGPSTTELRYFRSSELDDARAIEAALVSSGLTVNLKYVPGFESSKKIRPRQFELWIAG